MRKSSRHGTQDIALKNCWNCHLSAKEDTTIRYLEASEIWTEIIQEEALRMLSSTKYKCRTTKQLVRSLMLRVSRSGKRTAR